MAQLMILLNQKFLFLMEPDHPETLKEKLTLKKKFPSPYNFAFLPTQNIFIISGNDSNRGAIITSPSRALNGETHRCN
jgi:hypothetical protein